MIDNRLLVPVAVEALIIGADGSQVSQANILPNFALMNFGITLGSTIEPPPFQPALTLAKGVHLRWALPDGITHGVQGQAIAEAAIDAIGVVTAVDVINPGFGYDPELPPSVIFSGGGGTGAEARAIVDETGKVTSVELLAGGLGYSAPPTVALGSSDEIKYPKVPDRWFIMRYHPDDTARQVALKSWVVVSNALSDNQFGRIVLGKLNKDLAARLDEGALNQDLLEAANQLPGVSFSADTTIRANPNSDDIWYAQDGDNWYSFEETDDALVVAGNQSISWPLLADPYHQWPPYKFMGQAWPYPDWSGQNPEEAETNLTAIGPGDPVFAAAYPKSSSVFGFYDDLSDLPNGGDVTYAVMGWYADPADNPLYGADSPEVWAERMDALRWCIKQDPGGYPEAALCSDEAVDSDAPQLPTDILCQGMVYKVAWRGPDADYGNNIPSGKVEVAIGNTSAEAVAALVATKVDADPNAEVGIEEILEAFQYDMLDLLQQPDGLVKLEQGLHAQTFGSRPGPSLWDVQLQQNQAAEDRDDNTTGQPYPDNVGQALSEANTLQTAYEQSAAELENMQWETYSAWFRKAVLNQSPSSVADAALTETLRRAVESFEPFPVITPHRQVLQQLRKAEPGRAGDTGLTIAQIIEVIEELEAQVRVRKTEVAQTLEQLNETVARLKTLVAEEMEGYEVVFLAGSDFIVPNDPVVLLSGDGVERGFAHGEDEALAEGESLPCRVSGQTITALTVAVPDHGDQTITQTQLQEWYGSFPAGPAIPADIEPLFIETMLLDTTMAWLMAASAWQLAGVDNPNDAQITEVAERIKQIQTAPLNAYLYFRERRRLPALDPQKLSDAAGFTGVYPYKLAVDPWSQPWSPVLLDWDVSWHASYPISGDMAICDKVSEECQHKWMFDEVDYVWNTKFDPIVEVPGRYLGQTVLAPNAPEHLAEKIKAYLEDHPDSPYKKELEAIYEVVSKLEVVSQNVSGFSSSLTQRRELLQMPVIDYYNPDLGQQVAQSIGTQNQASPRMDSGYNPLRGGHTQFIRLWVIDSFGQVQRVTDTGVGATPILSKPLVTEGYEGVIQLTPRVVQPSRLELSWIDAEDDQRHSTSDPTTSPLIGWVVPNYFDNSIMIYNAKGKSIGSLQLLQGGFGDGGSGVRWLETPGTTSAVGAQPSLDDPLLNSHLKGFINGILGFGVQGRDALSDLITTLNRTLGKIVVTGSAANYGNLPVLIGRPMALVRASIEAQLNGLPAYDQSWEALKYYYEHRQFVTEGFLDVSLPVQIGDVRLQRDGIVGYFNGDNYQQFNSKLFDENKTLSSYIAYQQRVHVTTNPEAPAQFVTLLVDPRTPIHMIADFVPMIEMDLPPSVVSNALGSLDMTFRVGPVLNEQQVLSMPLPADIHGSWSWVYHQDVTAWSEDKEIQDDTGVADLPDAPRHINEGWLKLSDIQTSEENP